MTLRSAVAFQFTLIWQLPRAWRENPVMERCPLRDCWKQLRERGPSLWLTTKYGADGVPHDDMEFLINMRNRLEHSLCHHQRRQKPDGTTGAKCLIHIDENDNHATQCLTGDDRARLHDVGCHILHKVCLEAEPKSQRSCDYKNDRTPR